MAAALFHLPTSRIIDTNGIADGATLTFYDTGTLTKRSVYTTSALSVEHPNPLTVAAGAAVPSIYLDDTYTYRCIVRDADGNTIDDIDPYTGLDATGLNFTQSGTGAVNRTAQAKLREIVSVMDFGATGDGTTDDTAAIQAAMDAHSSVLFPPGSYKLTDKLTLNDGQSIHCAPGVTITQTTASRQIFTGDTLTGLTFTFNNALLIGEGTYKGGGDHRLLYYRYAASAWASGTAYAVGDFRYNGSNVYRVTTAGTSAGSGGPTGTTSSITDNTVTWEYVGTRLLTEQVFWSTVGASLDRAIELTDCSKARILHPRIRDCGSAGIVLIDCSDVFIDEPEIEGTHDYSTAIANDKSSTNESNWYWANNQMGIYLRHTASGNCDKVVINSPRITGVCHGILNESSNGTQPDVGIQIINPTIHGIPGQHAFYLQSGNISISSPHLRDIELAGVKVQSTSDNNNIDISNVVVSGINSEDVRSNLVELAQVSGTGSVTDVYVSGVGKAVGTGLGVVGKVQNVRADLLIEDADDYGFLLQGSGPAREFDIAISVIGSGAHGICVTSTDASGIRIRPIVRDAGGVTASQSGILVSGNGATVDVYDPVISGTDAIYAINASASGATIKVHGEPVVSAGSTGTYNRASGATFTGVWMDYTPTYSVIGSGSITTMTTNSARWVQRGQTVSVCFDATVTDEGTASGALGITLPATAKKPAVGAAFEHASSGDLFSVAVRPTDLTKMVLNDVSSSGDIVATGRRFIGTLVYEAA